MQLFFDLDGPLLDNRAKYWTLYEDLLAAEGYAPIARTEYWEAKRARVAEREIVERTCPADFVERYSAERIRRIEDLTYLTRDRVWPGLGPLLDALAKAHELYVVTMRKRRDTLLAQLGSFDLARRFRHVYSRDANSGTPEVKVELIRDVVDDPGRAMIVGDTESDIEVGRRLGITTVGVTCGIRAAHLMEASGCDHLIPRVDRAHLMPLLA